MTAHVGQSPTRFRRKAFGRRSDRPIQRIEEDIAEIDQLVPARPSMRTSGRSVARTRASSCSASWPDICRSERHHQLVSRGYWSSGKRRHRHVYAAKDGDPIQAAAPPVRRSEVW